MSNYLTENLRTVALVGHGSCGKTTLIEAMLYRTGMISELGSIERGDTMCDNDALEKQVQHSIRLAVAHVDTALPDLTPVRIHVLDTPGYPDYIGQDMSALNTGQVRLRRHRRHQGRRASDAPHDGHRQGTRSVPHDRDQQVRRTRRRPRTPGFWTCRKSGVRAFSRSTFPPTTAPSSSTASTRTKEKPTFSASVKSIAPSLKRSSSRTTKCSSTISRKGERRPSHPAPAHHEGPA